ncbi:HNH endonuclease [candidate division WOR-1 bacterium RIFCSPHIGHO2_01_FULL_53_15]|uniref:HNH endonuclease n=1 Tax=candidate division WOR-1 bacterium RIFCSPHIGHO2_01_FULL_53_15 TaxID=1802564 RepID=A0A1F4PZV3_UNCSA|nr:MAG: HNH endonuclease [candidate division WOR-1 bacterium RIFCSPHIGHO2_01_FULL_53_15]OGC10670.1 MAG: HNH endonuclease [candidate division WOR-1 bacterium RIFCSPHIGHO2_02_FULL_53_26]
MKKNVLVLNSTHLPINITGWKRALILLYKGKAAAVKYNGCLINGRFRLPEIIKLLNFAPVPYADVVLSRKNIFLRDNHTCQYCGRAHSNLTIDHILPRSRGGDDSWTNMVVCCARCNCKKGDRTLEEAGLKLKGSPYRPSSALYLHMTRMSGVPASWHEHFFKTN